MNIKDMKNWGDLERARHWDAIKDWGIMMGYILFVMVMIVFGFCYKEAHGQENTVLNLVVIPNLNDEQKLKVTGTIKAGPARRSFKDTDENAIRAIVGEAEDQGYDGMLAVACGIRNRGNLKGVIGFKSKRPDKAPQWVWDNAKRAWFESRMIDTVQGAQYWENVEAFGTPPWIDDVVKTVKIGDHQFYRGKNVK